MTRAVGLLLLGFVLPAFGQPGVWWASPQSRQAHARNLQKDFHALYDQIPTLSPSEERWLKTEYDDTIAADGNRYTKRAMEAAQSREYQIRVVKPHARQIDSELWALGTGLRPSEEAVHWTRLATLLMDFEFWQSIDDLQTRGVIEREKLKFLGEFHSPTATLWAQQMLTEIVLPYLEAKQ